jgi:hypothetical protein
MNSRLTGGGNFFFCHLADFLGCPSFYYTSWVCKIIQRKLNGTELGFILSYQHNRHDNILLLISLFSHNPIAWELREFSEKSCESISSYLNMSKLTKKNFSFHSIFSSFIFLTRLFQMFSFFPTFPNQFPISHVVNQFPII